MLKSIHHVKERKVTDMKYPIVARNFLTALSERNMTQQDLANISGIGKSSISHYCHGTHCPDNLRAITISKILNVNPLWLMGLSEIKEPVSEDKAAELERLFFNAPLNVQESVLTLLKAAQPLTEHHD